MRTRVYCVWPKIEKWNVNRNASRKGWNQYRLYRSSLLLYTSVSFLIGIDQNYNLKEWIIYHYQYARFHTFVLNLNVWEAFTILSTLEKFLLKLIIRYRSLWKKLTVVYIDIIVPYSFIHTCSILIAVTIVVFQLSNLMWL